MKIQANKITISKTEWIHIGKEAGWDNIDSTTDSSNVQGFSYQDDSDTQIAPEAYKDRTKDSTKKRNFSYTIKAIVPVRANTPEKAHEYAMAFLEEPKEILESIVEAIEIQRKRGDLPVGLSKLEKEEHIKNTIYYLAFEELSLLQPSTLRTEIYKILEQCFYENKDWILR